MHGDTGVRSEEDVVADTSTSAADVAAALAGLGAATLGESGGRAAHRRLRPAWPGATLAAAAYPVRCTPGDNLAVHVAVTRAPRGSVLCVDVGRVPDRGYWGEVLTTAAEARGIKGLVIDGGVRDVDELEAHGFPVFSVMVALRGATKSSPGRIGGSARVGDVEVETGDWVVGDTDGVTVVARDQLDAVLVAGRARADKEQGFVQALQAGRTTLELLGLDDSPIKRA